LRGTNNFSTQHDDVLDALNDIASALSCVDAERPSTEKFAKPLQRMANSQLRQAQSRSDRRELTMAQPLASHSEEREIGLSWFDLVHIKYEVFSVAQYVAMLLSVDR
jgi:hypothetical protein